MKFEDRHIVATFWAGVLDLILGWGFGIYPLGSFGISLISYSLIHQLCKSKDKMKEQRKALKKRRRK